MPSFLDNGDAEDHASLLSARSVRPSPDTLTKLVKRLRALTLALLPVEVEPENINAPTSRVITPQVISAYRAAAGDFTEALPYCLLRARAEFLWDASHNPADYGENYGRAVACEVLARRIVHLSPPDRLSTIMSTRYQHRQLDGDDSEMTSALETAIDGHCTIFLSSTEAQDVVNALWTGEIVQKNNAHHDIDYVSFTPYSESTSFWSRLDPSRLSVPRYQNAFRIIIWLFFLVVYSQAVREPLERLDDNHLLLDNWEIVLYFMGLSFAVEDFHKFFTLLKFVTWRAFTFWNVMAFFTDSLLLAAFTLRVMSLQASPDQVLGWRLKSFQVLSFVSPFIWWLVTVFDGFKYVGTMQICISRMLKESGIFFALLSVLGIGFAQGMYALDAADGTVESAATVINALAQALLSAPDYGRYATSPAGMILFYFWNTVTAIILLNVLISLFSSAYSDVVDDAEAQYLAFFAGKTVGMIRAPDSYVYPAPFNLIEIILVAPFELFMSSKRYATYNRYVMGTAFFIPLSFIAFFESSTETRRNRWLKDWLRSGDEGEAETPAHRDPIVDDQDCPGLSISKVPFEDLIQVFPNTQESAETSILKEIDALKQQLAVLVERLEAR
ncbi:calcium activated cation channel [Pluteus cervinus]|uniref:Calcium activated cation channel n=1 Tax=Pluteus cervinus TaxID=181527 RepID=A0ACD3ASI1_9AGAR|nr:calcium activated cation channel [Pluteus cervinus]